MASETNGSLVLSATTSPLQVVKMKAGSGHPTCPLSKYSQNGLKWPAQVGIIYSILTITTDTGLEF